MERREEEEEEGKGRKKSEIESIKCTQYNMKKHGCCKRMCILAAYHQVTVCGFNHPRLVLFSRFFLPGRIS